MKKISCRIIIGLIGSLTLVSNTLAKQININMDSQGAIYLSPIVYLTGEDGQQPKVAIKEGETTTAGVDENEDYLTKFTSVSFEINPKIESIKFQIISISKEMDPFCKELNISLDGNKIFLPSKFPKLTTSTSCHFKIVSLDRTKNEVTENKITFIFNYTLKGWLSDLGNITKAKQTAEIIRNLNINPNSTTIDLVAENIVDLSPIMGFIKTEGLFLSHNHIKVIPDAIGNLINLKYLYFHNNKITKIPNSIGRLVHLQEIALNKNQIEEIPDEIGNLTNLIYLLAPFNQIKVIPDVIGKLKNLQYLYFHKNKIKIIPNSIGELVFLKEIGVNDNQIKCIPNAIKNITQLIYLNFKNNQIHFINKSIKDWLLIKNAILVNNPGFNYDFENQFGKFDKAETMCCLCTP